MPAPLVAMAIVQAKASIVKSLGKSIRDIGQKILSELLGCKIKPKGTPHETVFQNAPKYFAQYGSGIPESGKNRFTAKSAVIEPVTGYVLSQGELEKILPLEDRRAIEATLRKKCERITGSIAYYLDVRPANIFRGYVRLADGNVYDAATYSLQGGDFANPANFDKVQPKTLPGQTEIDSAGNEKQKTQKAGMGGMGIVIAGLAIAGLATGKIK